MNNLEKLNALIATGDRTIVYGKPVSVSASNLISLSIGESDSSIYAMGDMQVACYITVNVSVYAADYMLGYNTLLAIKNEIQSAAKTTVNIIFTNFGESEYDAGLQRHVLISKYKIIE